MKIISTKWYHPVARVERISHTNYFIEFLARDQLAAASAVPYAADGTLCGVKSDDFRNEVQDLGAIKGGKRLRFQLEL
jgi:hypothetical protein